MRQPIARRIGLLAAPALLAFWLIAVPTAMAGDPCYHGFEMPKAATEATNKIKLADCAFGPTIARVPVGSTVTFFNGPNFAHLITGANQAWGSRDVEVPPNATASYTFAEPGLYPYACALHRGMTGAIIVGDGTNVLAAGTTGETSSGEGTAGAASDATTNPPIGTPALVAAGTMAGIVVGAGAVWLMVRRRAPSIERLVQAD